LKTNAAPYSVFIGDSRQAHDPVTQITRQMSRR
jgi:hypothetical protein